MQLKPSHFHHSLSPTDYNSIFPWNDLRKEQVTQYTLETAEETVSPVPNQTLEQAPTVGRITAKLAQGVCTLVSRYPRNIFG
jgi:hypothetical protein